MVIYESNGNLFDITSGDSLRIVKDVILIKFCAGLSKDSIASIETVNSLERRYTCLTGWIIYDIPDTTAIVSLVENLLTQIDTSKLEFNFQMTYFSSTPAITPDDPEYEHQWYLYDEFGIHMPEAWELTTGDANIVVAILDNGVDYYNPDLGIDLNNAMGFDFTKNPPEPNVYPSNSGCEHGTMVTSIIAAKSNNSLGTSGIAGGWDSSPVKVAMCKIGDLEPNLAAAAIAIDWGILQGIRLFNMSFGLNVDPGVCSCYSNTALKDIIDLAYDEYGAVMFSSAGNDDLYNQVAWPGCGSKVIAVGGTYKDGNRWIKDGGDGSNYGPNTDISAPSGDIYHPKISNGYPPNYQYDCGTSCGTAMAVGVAALMLSVNPCLTNMDIQYILQETADKIGYYTAGQPYNYNWDPARPGHSEELGYGKINAYNAILMADHYTSEIAEYQNIVFDKPMWFTHNLTLLPTSTLTITSTVKFNEGCKIIVMPGAQLIVDGGTITSSCPGFWGGIEVWGNRELAQYPISNQGYLHIFNNAKIEKANPGIYSSNGGLVVASDVSFINNKRSVIMSNYPAWNHSTFTRCTFELTDASGLSGNQYFIGAELIHPLRISGCIFANKIPEGLMAYPLRGYGILSLDADIYVYPAPAHPSDTINDSIQPVFRNLKYGLYSMRSGTQNDIHITDVLFEMNMRGAYISGYTGSSYAMVARSEFIVQDPIVEPGGWTYGLYMDRSTGFTVEENEFYSDCNRPQGYGLIINESGTNDNEVYNNSFHNLQYATQAQGCNRYSYPYNGGLCFRCNDFFDNENDVFIVSDAPPGTRNQGISLSQGDKKTPAKNTFTVGNDQGFDMSNPFDIIQYFHDENANFSNVIPLPNVGVSNNVVDNSSYSKQLDCPSHFGGFYDMVALAAELTEAEINVDSLQTVFIELMDGGSTEELVNEVQTSILPDALEIRNELITQSPYLSDSVMQTAISKEDVLPNAMIRDILVENPQSAKSDALIEALDQRFIPMPDSMMAQIMEGESFYGAKEELEQELINWKSKYAVAMKHLLRLYDQDTSGVYGADSIISLLTTDGSLMSHYDIVALYYRKGAFETGTLILNTIPFAFTLSDDQILNHSMYVTLFSCLQQVMCDSAGFESLDSAQFSALNTLALNDNLPGALARNLLIKKGLLPYEEPILVASSLKESKKWRSSSNDRSFGTNKDTWLKVYPNPANDYFIVEYHTSKSLGIGDKISISVTDIMGREFYDFSPTRNFDQVVIPTKTFPMGTYIINLKFNGEQKEYVKLIIK